MTFFIFQKHKIHDVCVPNATQDAEWVSETLVELGESSCEQWHVVQGRVFWTTNVESGSQPLQEGLLHQPPEDDEQFPGGTSPSGKKDTLGSVGEQVEGEEADLTSLVKGAGRKWWWRRGGEAGCSSPPWPGGRMCDTGNGVWAVGTAF